MRINGGAEVLRACNYRLMSQQHGLGRGLSSLIPNAQPSSTHQGGDELIKKPLSEEDVIRGDKFVVEVDINQIIPNPHQPRYSFDEARLDDLANSIKTYGIIQPIVVTKNGSQYEIIAGERRFKAAKIAGLKKVPVILREAGEREKLELAIIENVQRHDLNAIEEARAYQKLTEIYQLTQEEVAGKIGKSRSFVANKTRLLQLPVEVQKALMEGVITEGHAKAILSLNNPEKQRALFDLILKSNLTVRQAEERTKEISSRVRGPRVPIDANTREIQNQLVERLGTKVKIARSATGGKIIIEYYSDEDLHSLLERFQ